MTATEMLCAKKDLAPRLNFPPPSSNTTDTRIVFHCSGKENVWLRVRERVCIPLRQKTLSYLLGNQHFLQ